MEPLRARHATRATQTRLVDVNRLTITAEAILITTLTFLTSTVSAQSDRSANVPTIQIDVSPGTGFIHDRFVVNVRITMSESHVLEQYHPPELTEFDILEETSHRSLARELQAGISTADGLVLDFRYSVAPKHEGLARIGGARARVSEHEIRTTDRAVRVRSLLDQWRPSPSNTHTKRPSIPAPLLLKGPTYDSNESRPDMFVHVTIDRKQPFVGEQVTVMWRLYSRHELVEMKPNMPRLDAFWSEILVEPSSPQRLPDEFVNDIRYKVSLISRRALFPLRAGRLTLEPYRARVATLSSPLGQFTEISSDPLEMEVQPLPGPAPVGFDPSYVGAFDIRTTVDQTRAIVGKPFVLTVRVNGHGALRRTSAPQFKASGFDVEAPQDFEETLHPTETLALGQRIYKYWLTPKRVGAHTIPPVTIHFFNPHTTRYDTARTEPIDIEVVGANHMLRSDESQSLDGPQHVEPQSADRINVWSVGLLTLAFTLLAILAFIVKRKFASQRTPSNVRFLNKRIGVATRFVATNDASALFRELSNILEHSLNFKLGLHVRALTRDSLARALRDRRVPSELVEQIHKQLDYHDTVRFTSSNVDRAEMTHALQRVRKLSTDIQSLDVTHPSDA